jgi:starch synthase
LQQPTIYFIRRDEFFDRSQLYNLSDRDYDDNFERFVFFQKAVVALMDQLGQPFHIVHAHDWQTALMPLYLRHGARGEGRSGGEKTVLTLHNLAFQGVFNGDLFSYSNLPFSCFSVETLEYYGNINCLKGGITTADAVTTVSATYAREIQTETWGCGLHGVLADVRAKLFGIVNGIDTRTWDPEHDKALVSGFSAEHLDGKLKVKADLIRRLRLKIPPEAPLLGMVTRLTRQKGIDLLDDILDSIMEKTTAGFALLGSGPDAYMDMVGRWAKRWPGRVAVRTGYDAKLAHRIEAAADIYLMPSEFEPCGLNQLYSLRYGTIPVVHAVGGLEDTIIDLRENPAKGYGFKFTNFEPEPFRHAVLQAIRMYGNQKTWDEVRTRAMRLDFSWTASAKEYMALYRNLIQQG